MASTSTSAAELAAVRAELEETERRLAELRSHRRALAEKAARLEAAVERRVEAASDSEAWEAETHGWSAELRERLGSTFGFSSFRPLQLSTMNAVLSGEDVLCVLSTGAGKSLCYQLPALLRPGFALVVSPLISLMEDQVGALRRLRYPAALLHSATPKKELARVMAELTDPKAPLKLLYVTPERVAKSKRFFARLEKAAGMGRLSLLAIDEVHCCSQWGHDFRPDYKFLNVLRRQFPKVPILGLTATATAAVLDDVRDMLRLPGALVFRAGFNRPNLHYSVRPKPKDKQGLVDALAELARRHPQQSGIVYALSRKDAEELAQGLAEAGVKAAAYHADMDPRQRSQTHERWIEGRVKVVVATVAFGMGIDKADVRWVAHASLAKSFENYYQESGRAGRDGARSECVLFFRLADLFRLSTMVCTEKTGLEKLYPLAEYALNATRCRRFPMAAHFEEPWEEGWCQGACDVCSGEGRLEREAVELSGWGRAIVAIAEDAVARKAKLTGLKLTEVWSKTLAKGSRERCYAEEIVGALVLEGWLREDFHFTPYAVISYLVPGPKAALAPPTSLHLPKEQPKATAKRKAK